MRNGSSGDSACDLRWDESEDITTRDAALHRVTQCDCGIEVSAGDRAECEDECNQCRAGRDGVCQECDCDVPGSKSLAHDAGADQRGDKQTGPCKFSGSATR